MFVYLKNRFSYNAPIYIRLDVLEKIEKIQFKLHVK